MPCSARPQCVVVKPTPVTRGSRPNCVMPPAAKQVSPPGSVCCAGLLKSQSTTRLPLTSVQPRLSESGLRRIGLVAL
jgi:hypothetical protein